VADFERLDDDARWLAGFEGDRRVVVARLGPYRRIFPRPQHYVRRFHHRVHELTIEDWRLPLESPQLGPLCRIEASLTIRFQPTLEFAREHLEHIGALTDYIRTQYQTLLQDAAEVELQALKSCQWMEQGHEPLEQKIEDLIHELLAIRDIQSRCRCRIEAVFTGIDRDLDEDLASTDPHRSGMAQQILKRQREAAERVVRERLEQDLLENRLKLEQQERMLNLLKHETELLRRRQEQESAMAREELLGEEARQSERLGSEIRLRQARILHENDLKRLELEGALEEKQQNAAAIGDVHAHLQKEVELLAMERQRLTLEEEIHAIKKARSHGWMGGVKSRFLGTEEQNPAIPAPGRLSDTPDKHS
jgi:hypothetical protein